MFRDKIAKLFTPRLRELIFYTAGCGFSLLLKVAVAVAIGYTGMSFWLAYLITHAFLIFSAFFYHHMVTFRKKFTTFRTALLDFRDFAAAVIAFKIVDYLLVNIGIGVLKRYFLPEGISVHTRMLFEAATIIGVGGTIFVFRYFIYRILFRKRTDGSGGQENGGRSA